MSLELYAAYLVACLVIVIVPGPTVTPIIANSLRHGTRAGLLNMLGTQVGLALMIGVVGIGLTSLIEAMGHWFDWLRIAGAAYLVWLGWKMIRSSGQDGEMRAAKPPRGGPCRPRALRWTRAIAVARERGSHDRGRAVAGVFEKPIEIAIEAPAVG